jgi:hypothetical protein
LELDEEDWETIPWMRIRFDLEQLKEWLTRHITKEPIEHNLVMVKRCSKLLNFTDEQQLILQRSIFLETEDIKKFMQKFRKALQEQVFRWS